MRLALRLSTKRLVSSLTAATALLALLAPTEPAAQGKPCGAYRIDPPLVRISGRLGDAGSFTGLLRISTPEPGRKPVFLTAGDVHATDGSGRVISESRIDITNLADELPPNEPRVVRVTVNGVRFAGTYLGRIALSGVECEVELSVVAVEGAALSLAGGDGDKGAGVRLIRCVELRCGPKNVAGALVPEERRQDQLHLDVNNSSQSPARVTNIEVTLRGDRVQGSVPEGAVTPQRRRVVLPASTTSSLPLLTIKREDLAADHYAGTMYVTVAGEPKRLELPIELDIADGPFWAIVAALLAFLIQAAAWLVTRNQPKKAALREQRRLRKALRVLNRADQELLKNRVDSARDLIVAGELEAAKRRRAAITQDARRLVSARELEKQAQEACKPNPPPTSVAVTLSELRAAVRDGDSAGANGYLTDLRIEVENLRRQRRHTRKFGVVFTAVHPQSIPLRESLRTSAGLGGLGTTISAGAWTACVWVGKTLLAGFRALRRVARRTRRALKYAWVAFTVFSLPRILGLIGIAAFVLFCLKQLYFDDATFGDDAVVDYGGIVLVGLAATAVNFGLAKVFK